MTAHLQTLCEWIWVNPWLFFSESLVEIQSDPPASAVLCQWVTGGTEQTRQKHNALISIFTRQVIVWSTLSHGDFAVKLDEILFYNLNTAHYRHRHTLGVSPKVVNQYRVRILAHFFISSVKTIFLS